VWASDFAGKTVRRFDPQTGKLVAAIHVAGGPEGTVVTPTAVWVADHRGGDVVKIDPNTNRVTARIQVGPPGPNGPQGIAFGLGSIWVGVGSVNQVVRIDPATNGVVARIGLPPNQGITPYGGIGVGKTAVWVSGFVSNAIARIDPETNTVASILTLNGNVTAITTVGDDAWFVSGGNLDYAPHAVGYLIELRPDDTVAHRIELGRGFVSGGIVNAFGSIWVSNWIKPLVLRIPA
jgi:YVTN family beta-propeller protein